MDGKDAPPAQAFTVSAASAGFIRLCWTAGCLITGSTAAAAMRAVDTINGGHQRPLLVEMAGLDAPTRDARQHFGRRCTASRIALLGKSSVDRVAASFVPRPGTQGFPVPTRFFTSEDHALAWLLGDES